MKSSHPSRLRKLRLQAADAPRIDLARPTRRERGLMTREQLDRLLNPQR